MRGLIGGLGAAKRTCAFGVFTPDGTVNCVGIYKRGGMLHRYVLLAKIVGGKCSVRMSESGYFNCKYKRPLM